MRRRSFFSAVTAFSGLAVLRPGEQLSAHTMLIGLAQERGCTYEKL